MRQAVTVGRLRAIPIELHVSWPPVFLFVAWLLAAYLLPDLEPDRAAWLARWGTALLTSGLLFASLLVHELAHAAVARRRGLPVVRVCLFALGGLAEIDVEAGTAGDEFWMALAGPAASLVLAVGCGAAWLTLLAASRLGAAAALYLAVSNALVALFNLLPGFPLDGGRLVRAALWRATGDLGRATRWAAALGMGLGGGLGALGGLSWIAGDPLAGAWLAAVGLFLIVIARGGMPSWLSPVS